MKKKSKFLTFILSFIPGLSHFYIGNFERGAIYLFLTGGLIISGILLGVTFYNDLGALMALAGIALVWLIALLDAFSSLSSRETLNNEEGEVIDKKRENKKIITLALSMIPGAGHMYLNYQKKGLVFMGGFFFTIFFMGWLRLSFLMFILPLIWFYSFFDAYHILNDNEVEDIDIEGFLPKLNQKYIGIALVVVGLILIFQNILYPVIGMYLDYRIVRYTQTLIVALIFILGGVKLIKGRKEIEEDKEDVEVEDIIVVEEGEKDE